MSEVEFVGVRKDYQPGVPVLHELDLKAEDGELLVLVGPSGCGKSTALRILAGLEEPTGGDVRIGGRSVVSLAPGRRDVAMVFQNYALYPHMTVRENLGFGLRVRKVPPGDAARRVRDVAELLGLSELMDRKPRALSGGQRQRVALGRALVREPRVFLLDEPLSNLDAQLRQRMRSEIKRLHERLGVTMVYVTHDQVEAMSLGHRVAVLKDGRLQQHGPPDEIYFRPANTFVATFFGSPPMNLVDCESTGRGLRAAGQDIAISGAPRWAAGRSLRLGLRAEDVRPAAGGLPATVSWAERLGHEDWLHADVAGVEWAVKGEGAAAGTGEKVFLGWDWGRAHWFDPGSGERLDPPAVSS